jgi:hypothetical protein
MIYIYDLCSYSLYRRTKSFLEEQKLFTCFLAQTLRKHTTSIDPGREVKLAFHPTTNYSISYFAFIEERVQKHNAFEFK